MKEGKKKIIKLKRIFATLLAVAMLVTNANIPVLAYDGTDDPPATENNLEGEGLPEVSEGEAEVSPEITENIENSETAPEVNSDTTSEITSGSSDQESNVTKTVTNIYTSLPDKSDYLLGIDHAIDYSGLYVRIDYSDGTSEDVYDGNTTTESGLELLYDDSSIDWNNLAARQETILISCGDVSTSFNIQLLTVEFFPLGMDDPSHFTSDKSRVAFTFTPGTSGVYTLSVTADEGNNRPDLRFYDENWREIGGNVVIQDSLTELGTYSLEGNNTYYLCVNLDDITSFTATLSEGKTIVSAKLIQPPSKTTYMATVMGSIDFFDFSGMQIEITFADNSTEIVSGGNSLSDGRGAGYSCYDDCSTPGTIECLQDFDGHEVRIPLQLIAPEEYVHTLELLEINSDKNVEFTDGKDTFEYKFVPETDGTYYFNAVDTGGVFNGETMMTELDGTVLQRAYSSPMEIKLTAGKTYIFTTYFYNGEGGTIHAEKIKSIDKLKISSPPTTYQYPVGYPGMADFSGMRVEVTYDDETIEEIAPDEALSNGRFLTVNDNIDFSTAGKYHITVSSNDISVSTDIHVLIEEEYANLFNQLKLGDNPSQKITNGLTKFVFTPPQTGTYRLSLDSDVDIYYKAYLDSLDGSIYDSMDSIGDRIGVSEYLTKGKYYILSVKSDQDFVSNITCEKLSTITNLKIISEPDIQIYPVGYSNVINYRDIRLEVSFDDKAPEELLYGERLNDGRYLSWSDNIDPSTVGKYSISINSQNGISVSTDIEIVEESEYISKLDSLSLEKVNSKKLPKGLSRFAFTPSVSATYNIGLQSDLPSSKMELTLVNGTVLDSTASGGIETMALTATLTEGCTYILNIRNFETCNADIVFERQKSVKNIEIISPPSITQYPVGYLYGCDYSGMFIRVTFDNEDVDELEYYDTLSNGQHLSINSDINTDEIGDYFITVSCGNVSDSTKIRVLSEEDYLAELPILSFGEKTLLDLSSGLTKYRISVPDSGYYIFSTQLFDESEIFNGLEITDLSNTSVVQNEAQVNTYVYKEVYLNANTTYICSFNSAENTSIYFNSYKATPAKSLKIVSLPYKTQYQQVSDEDWFFPNLAGLSVQITYDGGRTEILNYDDATSEGRRLLYRYDIDGHTPGKYPISISLGDINTSFDIEILSESDYINSLDSFELDRKTSVIFNSDAQTITYKYTPAESGVYLLNLNDTNEFYSHSVSVYLPDGTPVETFSDSSLLADVILEGGKTYLFDLYRSDQGTSTYTLTKAETVENIELVSGPRTTTFLPRSGMFADRLFAGIELKVTYASGKTITLQQDDFSSDGRQFHLDLSQISWLEIGNYKAYVKYGEKTISFDVNIVNAHEYFQDSPLLQQGTVKGLVKANQTQKYCFTPADDGYYHFYLTHSYRSSLMFFNTYFYDDQNNSLDPTRSFPDIGMYDVVDKYTLQLQKGRTYYLDVDNLMNPNDEPYTLQVERAKPLKSIQIKELPSGTTRIVGADFDGFTFDTGIIEATYIDGNKEILSRGSYSVDINYNSSIANTYPQIVRYLDQSTSFDIHVVEPKDYTGTIQLTENQFTEIDDNYLPSTPFLFKFTPAESKNYYINLHGPQAGSSCHYKLLSENGELLDESDWQSDLIWNVALTKGHTYYIALNANLVNFPKGLGISITDNQVSVSSDATPSYTGKEITPELEVTLNGKVLNKKDDYTVSYHNNINAGFAYADVTSTGKIAFAPTRYFYYILPLYLEHAKIDDIPAQLYTGKEIKPEITVVYDNQVLEEDKDYTLEYFDNVEPGIGRLQITGMGNYANFVIKKFEIKKANIITYELNGGTNNPGNPEIYDATDITLKDPSRKDYLFDGWYTDKDCKTKITTIKGGTNKNYTLYAKWTKISVGKVSGLTATASSTSSVDVKWTSVEGADGYVVEYSENKLFKPVDTLDAATTSASITGLPVGSTRYIRVYAYVLDSAGERVSGESSDSVYFKTVPDTPEITKISGTTNNITLTWNDVDGEDGYIVYVATEKNGSYRKAKTLLPNVTSHTQSNLAAAKTYYFKVYAYNLSDGQIQTSSDGNIITGSTSTAVPSISSTTGGNNKVTLTWNNVSGETKYQIYVATSPYGTYNKLTTLAADTTTYTQTGLATAKTYYYKIRTYRSVDGEIIFSNFSNVKSCTTSPSTPTITSVTGGVNKATIRWKAVTGATGYVVYMATSSNGTYKNIGTVKSNTLALTKTSLPSAKNYYFKVRAYRTAGPNTVYSNYSTYKWCGTSTVAPSINKITAGANKVALAWKDVTGETKYQIYISTSLNGTYSKIATLNANTTSYIKTGLTKGRTYYFKIRTYRTINGEVVFSNFSSAKSAKAK